MVENWVYAIISVFFVSLISFIGIFTLSIKIKKLNKIIIYFISFSVGALFGTVFFHIIPEIIEKYGFDKNISILILSGIAIFFVTEKIIHWRHLHLPSNKKQIHRFAIMNIVGDGVHNFLDGLIIGSSYLLSIPTGIAATIAVMLHEIPQEIGDFGVLVHGGFSRSKALFINFLSGSVAILGTIIALVSSKFIPNIEIILAPIAAGGFIYIAGSDLMPELHKRFRIKESWLQLISLLTGMSIMLLITNLG
jgi:zinc and cadmium transporter